MAKERDDEKTQPEDNSGTEKQDEDQRNRESQLPAGDKPHNQPEKS